MAHEVSIAYYQSRLRIDKNDLDEEVVEQPVLFQDVCDQVAETAHKREMAKEEQKRVDARLSVALRKKASEDGDKLTETALLARVEKHPDHQKARDEYKDASREADQWLGLKESYQQRSYGLKLLTDLWVAGYYTTTTTRGGDRPGGEDTPRDRRALDEARRNRRERGRDRL